MKPPLPVSGNLFEALPERPVEEDFQTLLQRGALRIERIVSFGHSSPAEGWYDQEQEEWVLLLQGEAIVAFADGGEVLLRPGSYLHLPAHCRHRVQWTCPSRHSVWLALHFG